MTGSFFWGNDNRRRAVLEEALFGAELGFVRRERVLSWAGSRDGFYCWRRISADIDTRLSTSEGLLLLSSSSPLGSLLHTSPHSA